MDELLDINNNIKPKTWNYKKNHKIYADWLGKELGYTKEEDWYNITKKKFTENKGGGLLNIHYNNSPIQFLKKIFPDYEWLDFKLGRTPTHYWENIDNHKKYAEWLGKELGYTKEECWYNISISEFEKKYGSGILNYYNRSPIQFVKTIYPDYEWLEWKFKKTQQHYWENIDNHKKYAEWLSKELEYTKLEDWYNITEKQIIEKDGCQCLSKYTNSPIQFVKTMYPQYEWLEWKFIQTSKNYWENIKNHKKYAEWLGKELKYTKFEDWYNITYSIIEKHKGGGLLATHYNQSPIQFLKFIFPDYKWLEWKFGMASLGTWKEIDNHKRYAEWLGKELEYTKEEDWYNISQNHFNLNNGGGLIAEYYNSSPIQFVKKMFPKYEWLEWKFIQTSKNYWENIENHKKYAEWLGKELGYTTNEDWYNISGEIIKNNYGGTVLNYYNGSPSQFVITIYNEYEFDEKKFCKYKTEAKIYNIIKNKFPTIISQFKQDWCKRIFHLPYDFCILDYKIIIELDGPQHFKQVSNWSSPEEQFKNDKYKEECANDNEYLIIRILQEDVLNDIYNWEEELFDSIEKIKNGYKKNIYLCKNEEYSKFI